MLKIKKTEWDLSPLLKSEDDLLIKEQRKLVEKSTSEFIKKWKNNGEYLKNSETLKEALDEYEKLSRNTFGRGEEAVGYNEGYYFWLRTQQDLNNPKIKAKNGQAEEFSKKISNELIFFSHNLAKIPENKQKEFLQSEHLKKYHHYLERLLESAKHLLNEESEKILNLKETPAHDNWTKMVSGFISKEEKDVLTENGKEKISFEEILGLIDNQKKEIRDDSARALNEILAKNADVAEAEINSILADKKIDDELRKFSRPDSARILADDVTEKFVDTLTEAVSEKFNIAKEI